MLVVRVAVIAWQAPYNKKHFKISMGGAKRYECGDNFFKLDMHFNASCGVPITGKNIDALVDFHLDKPKALPLPFIVAVKTGQDPEQSRGHLQSVSPIELRMAVLRAVARDANDEDALKAWRVILLSCRFVYLPLDSNDECWKQARQLREDIAQNYTALRLSALQAIYEVVHFRRRHEKLHGKANAKQIAEAYRHGIKFADTSEDVTDSFVDMAMTIDNRMLSNPEIAKTLMQSENDFMSHTPFNGVSKLQAIISKARSPEKILWAVQSIHDMCLNDMKGEQVSLRYLQGTQSGAGGKGLVDLLNLKYDIKEYIRSDLLAQYPLWGNIRAKFGSVLENHASYRSAVGANQKEGLDLTWRASWPASAENAFQACEAIVYSDTYDTVLKTALRSRKSCEECFSAPGLSEIFAEIDEEYAEEKKTSTGDGGDDDEKPEEVADSLSAADADASFDLGKFIDADVAKSVSALVQNVDDANKEKVKSWKNYAAKLVDTHVKLLAELPSEQQLATAIGTSAAGQLRGDPHTGKHVGVVYDVKVSGETITQPAHRVASFRIGHFKKLLGAAFKSRSEDVNGLHDGDIYILPDGGKHGNEGSMMNAFCTDDGRMATTKRSIWLHFTEESVTKRYNKVGGSTVQQEELMNLVSRNPLHFSGRKRRHFEGTHRGSILGPMALESYDSVTFWKLPEKEKRDLFGKANRIAVGGAGPDADAGADQDYSGVICF